MTTGQPLDRLILVKHSLPEITSGAPPAHWQLSAEGRNRCQPLAARLAAYAPLTLISSVEVKAIQTAELVSQRLRLPFEVAAGLHEHERPGLPIQSDEEFQAQVRGLFARPDELVMGAETASQARRRFIDAVRQLSDRFPAGNLALVTHGTVITLFVAAFNPIEPFAFWQKLALPDVVVLSRKDFQVL